LLLFAGFSLTVDRFLTANNLLNILQQIAMLTIVGAGLTFGFAAREMALSVGYMVGMAGILVPLLLVAGTPLPLALLAGLG
ncbi:ABC transporter permease, partial [Citrobacter freundii]